MNLEEITGSSYLYNQGFWREYGKFEMVLQWFDNAKDQEWCLKIMQDLLPKLVILAYRGGYEEASKELKNNEHDL